MRVLASLMAGNVRQQDLNLSSLGSRQGEPLPSARFTCACLPCRRRPWKGQGKGGSSQAWAIAKGETSVELNVFEFNQAAIAFL